MCKQGLPSGTTLHTFTVTTQAESEGCCDATFPKNSWMRRSFSSTTGTGENTWTIESRASPERILVFITYSVRARNFQLFFSVACCANTIKRTLCRALNLTRDFFEILELLELPRARPRVRLVLGLPYEYGAFFSAERSFI